jgi:hypothetical protein
MSSSEKAAQLYALAAQHEALGVVEDAYEAATTAYQEDKSEENKAAFKEAAEKLRASRREIREADVMAVANEPGSSTVGVAPIQAGSKSSAPVPAVKEI